ncbi:hypothetical protein ACQR10_28875 [Bradyrhizobium sp. HKCCYLRH2060]|uniref:hypothetical protein n=1 Tax=Bradyrhizobium TaxID=374 RepID=UPI002916A71A|nr:hypothetical protein [Bradyrhizobium sp. SZCCHNR3003]
MPHRFIVSIVMLLLLLPAIATAAPSHKRKAHRWQGYGFLPGYKQPPNNSLPLYADKEAMRNGPPRGSRRHWYIDGTPKYMLYNGEWHYFGQPGFYRGHYNGGSFGPCWTRTPVGMVWTCG